MRGYVERNLEDDGQGSDGVEPGKEVPGQAGVYVADKHGPQARPSVLIVHLLHLCIVFH